MCGVFAGVVAGAAGCSRADVYPVTGAPAGGGGSGGGSSGVGGAAGGGGGGAGGQPVTCPVSPLPVGDTTRTVQVGSVSRSYVLHVPSAYDGKRPAPLVVDFHGVGESGSSERVSSPYPAALDPEGVIMAFPDGLRGPAGTGWNVGPCCVADVDDVAFARALVAQVQALACIDATRVYAVGVLTGGGMAHFVACHAADVFAAAAPAAFDLLEENVNGCVPARPITVISFRGTADSRVPYTGGPSALVPGMPLTFLGAQATFEAWARIDRCTGSRSAVDSKGCSSYAGCQDGVEVILCTKQDGREEPGDPSVAWPVLKRHTL
jgi:polyhydroxybutyrate depolymerase